MKKLLLIFSLFFSVCVSAQVEKVIPARPSPAKLVNDFAGLLTAYQVADLERKLVAYDDSTSNQVAIVIVKSLEGYEANEYAVALGRKWGVGNKDFNNGVIVLISTGGGEGQRDAYIATGYGLEGAIPDITAKAIVDNELIPNFKEGNYYRGLDEATDAIIKAAAGEYKAPANYGSHKKKTKGIGWFIALVIILIIFSQIGGSSGGGTYVSRGGFGGWSGGSGWSGGGGGGGFGGFGGGSFGGGGAGGKW
ncbi:MAG: TPM domain-containing protein [Sphingobacteriales bacterium]|nr:TPM domain-containing protein [Sphingobacteriales bacterium]